MEFTYDGMTRWGFGFANPNHAAALFAILAPFFWGVKERFGRSIVFSSLAALAESTLYVCLALTYSRSGCLAVAAAGCVYLTLWRIAVSRRDRDGRGFRKFGIRSFAFIFAPLLVFVVSVVITGSGSRLASIVSPDASVLNRFELWSGAARMFADSPFGVGAGNSGWVYSVFYQAPGRHLVFRTMVNSFLTPLVELGVVFGGGILFLSLFSVFSAVSAAVQTNGSEALRIWGRVFAATSTAVFVCGMSSTCFDLNSLHKGLPTDVGVSEAGLTILCGILILSSAFLSFFQGRRIVSAGAVLALSLTISILGCFWGLGVFKRGEVKRLVVETNGHFQIEMGKFPAFHGRNRIVVAIAASDVSTLRETRFFLSNHFPESVLVFPLNTDKGVSLKSVESVVVSGDLTGFRKIEIPGARSDGKAIGHTFQIIVFRPAVPPPVGFPLESVSDVFLDEYNESGYNSIWNDAIPASRIHIVSQ